MTKLVCCNLEKVGASVAVDAPVFRVVKVSIASINWEISVCKGAARSIEGIAIPMFSTFEPNIDVNLKKDYDWNEILNSSPRIV